MPLFKSESEMAAHVVRWLDGFDVYQEVSTNLTSAVADIVVDTNGWPWVIETKLSLGLSVLEQAWKWKYVGVPRVSVAVPATRAKNRWFAQQIAKSHGIGVLEVGRSGDINEIHPPQFTRPVERFGKLWNLLHECTDEHKSYCPAGSQGGRYTPFKATVSALIDVVNESPGITMKDAVEQIKDRHHYRTNKAACANLMQWLRTGVITDVELRKGAGRAMELHPATPITPMTARQLKRHENGRYKGTPCTCSESCRFTCTGHCGCEACRWAFSDHSMRADFHDGF